MVNSSEVLFVVDLANDLSSSDDQFSGSDSDDACLFINDTGEALSFILNLSSVEEVKKYTKLITDRFGVVKKLKDFGDYDAVLVRDACITWGHSGDVFKVSYIEDCIEKGILLNITNYRYNANSKLVDNFNYMDIIYRRRFTWSTIPEKYLKLVPEQLPRRQSIEDRLLDDDSDDEMAFHKSSGVQSSNPNKRTKALFTATEKRKMIDYIFKKKKFDMLKGNLFWKQMEVANICPIRTWQSLKNHFSKTLAYDVALFDLPAKDVKEFKRVYFTQRSHASNSGR